jgi:hypothetical protein
MEAVQDIRQNGLFKQLYVTGSKQEGFKKNEIRFYLIS